MKQKLLLFCLLTCFASIGIDAQFKDDFNWSEDGNSYYDFERASLFEIKLPKEEKTLLGDISKFTGDTWPNDEIADFKLSTNGKLVLIFTNTKKVWRYNTKGDYWIANLVEKTIKKIGKKLAPSSLMFAKLSPDNAKVAYSSNHNLFVEDISSGIITPLTNDGNANIINGTFDWVYEEEFDCRDGFRWSPDSKKIAFWRIDASQIKHFLMINNTDSIYSYTIPVEYPKVGEDPSECKVGVADLKSSKTTWLEIPGSSVQNYITRMEWTNDNKVILQQLNRKQNNSKIFLANPSTGMTKLFSEETSDVWIDIKSSWKGDNAGWDFIENGKSFIWVSEKDNWRHIYKISLSDGKETLLTKGNYDITTIDLIDEKNGLIYFTASPFNATQRYLYKISLNGKGDTVRVSPKGQDGTHGYSISPNGKFAKHTYSSHLRPYTSGWVALPNHESFDNLDKNQGKPVKSPAEFFQVTTDDNITLDGWMVKPTNFDSTKKYPVLFYVYSEPATSTVKDVYGAGRNFLYAGDYATDGYIYISLDGRGTPVPKGAAWRKSIYQKIGILNVRDQAMAAKKIAQWPFVDKDRIAVWGWSGGGSTTLNLMFQYPEIYSTGIAIAPVANRLCYDNIYEERYMGLPDENKDAYFKASAINHVKGLKGKLLVVHGTGDDNVHYQNTEMLVNELVKHGKQFSLMSYPNRSHGLREGKETIPHLMQLYTNFLKTNCPPGAK